MKRLLLVVLVLLIMAVGCNIGNEKDSNVTIISEHKQYLQNFSWHIQERRSTETKIIDFAPEHIKTLQTGGLDLTPYKKKEATVTSYLLEEKQKTGDKMFATIYEIDGEIIGGFGVLDNWSPGIFSLDSKKRLIEKGVISE